MIVPFSQENQDNRCTREAEIEMRGSVLGKVAGRGAEVLPGSRVKRISSTEVRGTTEGSDSSLPAPADMRKIWADTPPTHDDERAR